MSAEIRNEELYLDRTFQHWHRRALPADHTASDLDLFDYCHACYWPLWLYESSTSLKHPTTVMTTLAAQIRDGIPSFLVIHDRERITCAREFPGRIEIDSEKKLIARIHELRNEHRAGCAAWQRKTGQRKNDVGLMEVDEDFGRVVARAAGPAGPYNGTFGDRNCGPVKTRYILS